MRTMDTESVRWCEAATHHLHDCNNTHNVSVLRCNVDVGCYNMARLCYNDNRQ